MKAASLTLLLALAACAEAPPIGGPVSMQAPATPAEWRAVDAATGQLAALDDLLQLAGDFPDSASVRLRLLNAALEAAQTEEAGKAAQWLVERGYAFSEGAVAALPDMLGNHLPEGLVALVARNGQPLERSALLAMVPAEALLVESVARAGPEGALYVTSIVSRALWRQPGQEHWQAVSLGQSGSLSGIVFDPARALVWAGSGVVEQTPDPASAFRGLIGVDAHGRVAHRIAAPANATIGDIALDDSGLLLASDPMKGTIYEADPNLGTMRIVLQPGIMRSPQGIALRPGSRLAYVSDYRYGLALLDRDSGDVSRLQSDVPAILDGIDGLWLAGDRLIAVQNGMSPMRIVALTLSRDGTRIVGVDVLERAHGEWTEPLGGSLTGEGLIYVANGQWDRFGENGAAREGRAPEPTQVRLLRLGK